MRSRGGYQQMRGGGWGKGVRSHPRAYYIRFTEEEAEPISKMLRKRRLTMQAFGHAAIMRALNDATLGKKTETEIVEEARAEARKKPAAPTGFGIRERLQEDRESGTVERVERERSREREPVPISAPLPSLASANRSDEVATLARMIVEAPQSVKKEIKQAACRTLAKGRTLEETERLVEDLNVEIKRLDGAPKTVLERVRERMSK